jgi:hypothetical protein
MVSLRCRESVVRKSREEDKEEEAREYTVERKSEQQEKEEDDTRTETHARTHNINKNEVSPRARTPGLHVQSDGLPRQRLDEDLHARPAAQAEHEVQRGLLLDVVVGERAAILQLLAREDEALLVRGDAFLVLDLLLHVFDSVRRLDVESDGLPREGLDEDLHARPAAQAEHQVQRGLLLDVVVGERAPVLQLLAREDEALLVGRDALLVLNLLFHVLDGVAEAEKA